MAQFFKPRKAKSTTRMVETEVDTLDHHGNGVTKLEGKVCFVEGALPGERVKVCINSDKKSYMQGQVVKVLDASAERVEPQCAHFTQCGGCSMQYLEANAQLKHKQQAVGALFKKFTALETLPWQEAIDSSPWGYRRSARVSVIEDKNDGVRVGFRQSGSKNIINIEHCPVLDERFANVFTFFKEQLTEHKGLRSISHLQLVAADDALYVVVRHTKKLNDKAKAALLSAAEPHNWQLIFQASAEQVLPSAQYQISTPEKMTLQFGLNNFIQVNKEVNQAMLLQAQQWLSLEADDQVLDLFCGVGNFSLLAANKAARVVGVEGVGSAVAHAKTNAQQNGLTNCAFHCFDLTNNLNTAPWFDKQFNVLILDPSRPGAQEVLAQLPLKQFKRILYVSCDPVTLARDSAVILESGFSLNLMGLMNMFPHTGHIESMALFERG